MSGCSAEEAMRFGWPEGITPEAEAMKHLWQWSVIAALIMGILVWALIFWTVTFHRHKDGKDEFPRQTGYNVPLELTYTAIPFVIVSVLFYFTVLVQNEVSDMEEPDVRVDVTAFQWNWKFGYRTAELVPGTNGGQDGYYESEDRTGSPFELQIPQYTEHGDEEISTLGPSGGRNDDIRNYLRYDDIETLGTSSEIPILVLPSGQRIEFELAAADVVHSFWVPEFLFKRDVLPFPDQNFTEKTFQVSEINREGAFVGRCAEMCGTYHSMMNFELRVVEPGDFTDYIRFREANPDASNAEALQAICQNPNPVTTIAFDTRRATDGDTPTNLGDKENTKLEPCTPAVIQ